MIVDFSRAGWKMSDMHLPVEAISCATRVSLVGGGAFMMSTTGTTMLTVPRGT